MTEMPRYELLRSRLLSLFEYDNLREYQDINVLGYALKYVRKVVFFINWNIYMMKAQFYVD